MMDGLRWLLLVAGVLVIAGVYWYSRRERPEHTQKPDSDRRVEPTLAGDADVGPGELPALDEVDDAEPREEEQPDQPQKIVTLRIVARDRGAFPGDELILSLRGIGMRHGKFGIFHRLDGSDNDRSIFCAASLVEPGSFDLPNIKDQQIPGISLFLILPGPIDAVEGFDMMMTAARTLAQSLSADLLDESGSTLSIQRERFMREEIIQFQHSILVA
jgi:cell division protein ZipA